VTGGVGIATTRVLLGYDRIVGDNIGLGIRVGYAFNGGPQKRAFDLKFPDDPPTTGAKFLAIHAEGRVSYWLGSNPMARAGFRPYLVLAGGMTQVDAKVVVKVYTNQSPKDPISLAAWKKAGTTFVGFGGGVMYPVGPGGITAEVKLQQMIGSSATGLGVTLGYSLGL